MASGTPALGEAGKIAAALRRVGQRQQLVGRAGPVAEAIVDEVEERAVPPVVLGQHHRAAELPRRIRSAG